MTMGFVITLATLALTLAWILFDLSRPRRSIPPLGPLCTANGKFHWDFVNEAERLLAKKTLELEEFRQKAGFMRAVSDLKRADDHLPGTDTAVVKAIDMKLEMARHMAARKKA